MKKYFALIAAILAVCTLALCVCSCGGAGTSTTSTPAATTDPVTPEESIPDSSAPTVNNKPTYTVTVKDENGNPVAGFWVKICEGESCKKPVVTGEDGSAAFTFTPNGEPLKAMIEEQQDQPIADAYEFSTEYFYFEEDATDIVITVSAKAE